MLCRSSQPGSSCFGSPFSGIGCDGDTSKTRRALAASGIYITDISDMIAFIVVKSPWKIDMIAFIVVKSPWKIDMIAFIVVKSPWKIDMIAFIVVKSPWKIDMIAFIVVKSPWKIDMIAFIVVKSPWKITIYSGEYPPMRLSVTGWWCKNHLGKIMEFVNGKDDIPYMKWNIKFMFETTNQVAYPHASTVETSTSLRETAPIARPFAEIGQEAMGSRHIAMILMPGAKTSAGGPSGMRQGSVPADLQCPCLEWTWGCPGIACLGKFKNTMSQEYLEPSPTTVSPSRPEISPKKLPWVALTSQWCDMISWPTSQNSSVNYVPCCRWTSDFEIQPWPMASWVSDSDLVLWHKITEVIFAKKHEVQVQYTRTCHFSTPPFIVSVFLSKQCWIHFDCARHNPHETRRHVAMGDLVRLRISASWPGSTWQLPQ